MKKYLFIIVFFYTNLLLAQQIIDLKLLRNNSYYYLLIEKDTIAFINQLPDDDAFFNGKIAITAKGNDFIFYKVNNEIDLHLNSKKKTFIFNGITYNFAIDYLQNKLVLFNGNKMILKVDGRNLKSGITISYYDEQLNVKLIYLAYMIKRDAKTKYAMKHSVYKIGSLLAGAFSIYSIIFLVK